MYKLKFNNKLLILNCCIMLNVVLENKKIYFLLYTYQFTYYDRSTKCLKISWLTKYTF